MANYSLQSARSRKARLIMIVLLVFVAAIIGSVMVVRQKYFANLEPVSASQKSHLVTVELGATASDIAHTLKDSGLIRETWVFEWYVRVNNLRDKLQAGTYYIRPSQDIPDIANILTQGRVATDLVTILPGQRLDQLKQSLTKYGFSPEEVSAALNAQQYKDHPALVDKPVTASLEGYLYPESFQKHADTELKEVITSSLNEMQKRLTPEIRASFVKQGLTVHEGVILASIVEQEVGKNADKPQVAQVFLKRLRENMALESDTTAGYGAILDGKPASLTYDSLYNTYKHPGLPPGPISNVTDSSLKAVANPASTDYLYFVAGDDGVTYFSRTLPEHEALTEQHCKKLCGN